MDNIGRLVADAVLGIDTLWGGDVMCPSGTGRFIADSWFSGEPLPAAYTCAGAERVRKTNGLSAKLTWAERRERDEVARTLRQEFLVSEERADKLSGAWGRHPLLGRMYLPAYRSGTEKVASLRRRYPAEEILPILYGSSGLVDAVTIDELVSQGSATPASVHA